MQDNPSPQPRRLPAWVLGGVLSLIVLAAWAAYVRFAPAPAPGDAVPPPQVAEAPPPNTTPQNTGELHLLLWRNLVPQEIVAGFEAESGLKVTETSYDTNEQLNAIIQNSAFAQDLVVVSGVGMKRLIAEDLVAPLPSLAAAHGLDPDITARSGLYDPGSIHSAVVLWGTLGLAYDAAKVAERLGDTTLDSWQVLFDPAAMAKLATCGVQIVDSPVGVFPIALIHLGRPANSATPEDTDAASRLWEAVRPSIGRFAAGGVADVLAQGKACFALATSGDAYQARKAGADIRYALPHEGTVVWYAMLGVAKTAANPAGAAKLAEYLLRPDVAARLSNIEGLPNAVPASSAAIHPDLRDDPNLIPPSPAFATFTAELEPSAAAVALRNRFWQLINAAAPPPTPSQP